MDLYRILSSAIRNTKKGLPRLDRIRICNNNWSELLFISLTRYDIRESGAEGRSRTDTSREARWILSPVRLPISPLRHMCISV